MDFSLLRRPCPFLILYENVLLYCDFAHIFGKILNILIRI